MRLTKRQLQRIIRENCGMDHEAPVEVVADEPQVDVLSAPSIVSESVPPEQALIVEMEVASRALEQVVESVQNAAQLCTNCSPEVAAQAPIVSAMVTQAEALQENLEAQVEVMLENAAAPSETPVLDAVVDMLA